MPSRQDAVTNRARKGHRGAPLSAISERFFIFIATLPPGTDKTYLRFGILAAGFFLLTYLAFRNLFLLELVFLLFLCVILVLIVRGWKQLDP